MNPKYSPTPSAPAGDSNPGGGVTEPSGALAETKEKITEGAREAAARVKGAASSTAARAKEQAQRFAAEKKETTASRIQHYGSAIHETARSLEEQDPNIAWFTHRAADRLQNIAEYMRTHDFQALRMDAENMARRHPGVFFGGMFVAGLIVGNMLKASQRRMHDEYDYSGENNYESDWSRHPAEQGDTYRPEMTEAERSAAGI